MCGKIPSLHFRLVVDIATFPFKKINLNTKSVKYQLSQVRNCIITMSYKITVQFFHRLWANKYSQQVSSFKRITYLKRITMRAYGGWGEGGRAVSQDSAASIE